jgi:hypothetical protein
MLESPYKKFTGITPTTEDFSSWDSAKWMDYLRFMDFHIEQVKKPKYPLRDGYVITKEKIDKIREWQSQSDHPWLEFIYRISNDDKTKYMSKIRTANAKAMLFLQIRPTLITNDMRLLMQKNEFLMGKYLRVNPIIIAPDLKPELLPAPVSRQTEILSDTIDLLKKYVDHAKTQDIEELSIDKVISAISKLVDAINKMQGKATKIGNLTLINTQGSIEEMESQMLGMVGK